MKKTKKTATKDSFFKAYYIIIIIYAIIGLMDSTFIPKLLSKSNTLIQIWTGFAGFFTFGVLILSIIAIAIFTNKKLAKKTLVIPIYHIAAFVIMFIIGFIIGLISSFKGVPPNFIWLIGVGIISSIFELIFSIYVLKTSN